MKTVWTSVKNLWVQLVAARECHIKTARRLLKEFWFPLLAALAWASQAKSATDVTSFTTAFAPAFFLISWGVGQVFRVQKQAKVEEGLSSIETNLHSRINNVIAELESLYSQLKSDLHNIVQIARVANRIDWASEDRKLLLVALLNRAKPVPLYANKIVWQGTIGGANRDFTASSSGVLIYKSLNDHGLIAIVLEYTKITPTQAGLHLTERGTEVAIYLRDFEKATAQITEICDEEAQSEYDKYKYPPR